MRAQMYILSRVHTLTYKQTQNKTKSMLFFCYDDDVQTAQKSKKANRLLRASVVEHKYE